MSKDTLADMLLAGFVLGFLSEALKAFLRRKDESTSNGNETHDAETRPTKGRDGRVR